MTSKNILINKAQCLRCGTILESICEDHKIICKCRSLSISGGTKDLIRYSELGGNFEDRALENIDYKEISTVLLQE